MPIFPNITTHHSHSDKSVQCHADLQKVPEWTRGAASELASRRMVCVARRVLYARMPRMARVRARARVPLRERSVFTAALTLVSFTSKRLRVGLSWSGGGSGRSRHSWSSATDPSALYFVLPRTTQHNTTCCNAVRHVAFRGGRTGGLKWEQAAVSGSGLLRWLAGVVQH